MPYVLKIENEGVNDCGEDAVNPAPEGKLDGESIVLGHEIEETITDPGAEDILGSGESQQNLGGWYDALDANENGDKCAWVGEPLTGPILSAIHAHAVMPRGLPTKRPRATPKVTGCFAAAMRFPRMCTPAFEKAKSGMMTKLTQGCRACSMRCRGDSILAH